MTNNMLQQARSRQQKLRDFHRRNRLKKHGAAPASTDAAAENGKEEVEAKQGNKQQGTSSNTVKARKAAVAPISNNEIESRWALTPSQKKLSALVSPTLPYHQHDKKCEKNSPIENSPTESALKVLGIPQQPVTGGVTPSSNDKAKPEKSSGLLTLRKPSPSTSKDVLPPAKGKKDESQPAEVISELKGTSIQPDKVPPPEMMASSQATQGTDSTKVKKKEDSIPLKCIPQPAQENASQPEQEGAQVTAVEVALVEEEAEDSAAAEKAAPIEGKVQHSERPPPSSFRPVVQGEQPPTLKTKTKCLEVAALNAATCPDALLSREENKSSSSSSSPPPPPSSPELKQAGGPLLVQEMTVDAMSPEDKVSIPKEQPNTEGGDPSEQPVDTATEDTMTTQSTEEIVQSSDSDHTPAIITFDSSRTKESSSIFSLLTPELPVTESAVVKPAAQDSAKASVASSEHHATHLPWDTTPDVAPGDSSSSDGSPKPQQAEDRLHSSRTPRATKTKAPAVVALTETTGEDETTGWEAILSRNSSSIKDKEPPEPLVLQEQQLRQQKQEEAELLDEEKKMEDEDMGGYVDGRTGKANFCLSKGAWRRKVPLSSRGGRDMVKEAGSFDVLSSITGSYEQQSLGQSEDKEDEDNKEDEGSAMLRPSSSNVSYELRIVSRMIDSAHLQLSSKVKPNDAAAKDGNSRDDSTNDYYSCSDNYGASTFEGPTSTFMDDGEEEFERTLSGQDTMPHTCRSDSTGFVTDEYSCDTSVTPAMESMDGDDECSELTPRTSSLLEEEDQCDTTVDTDLHQATRSFSFSAAASGSPDDLERRTDVWSFFSCPFMCT